MPSGIKDLQKERVVAAGEEDWTTLPTNRAHGSLGRGLGRGGPSPCDVPKPGTSSSSSRAVGWEGDVKRLAGVSSWAAKAPSWDDNHPDKYSSINPTSFGKPKLGYLVAA